MKTAEQVFSKHMEDPVYAAWFYAQPEKIQSLIKSYPQGRYKVKPGAPYVMTCPDSIVTLVDYIETGNVKVLLKGVDKLWPTIEYEKELYKSRSDVDIEEILRKDRSAQVKPSWLHPFYE